MTTLPTPLDLWLARLLAKFAHAHPQFALAIDSGIRHTLFGGFWFGAALFIFWIYAERCGRREVRLRVLTILVGSAVAILLTVALGAWVSWPPPMRNLSFKYFYPTAMQTNLNTNCFPSQSTAAYAAIAAGIYSLHKACGWALWILVAVFIALPRMFVGGHYFTDIWVGTALALAGYAAARYLLEARVTSGIVTYVERRRLARLLLQGLIFFWIVQVTVEFRELTWAKVVAEYFLR
jgi:membrane-associated phospholipid phosphatase